MTALFNHEQSFMRQEPHPPEKEIPSNQQTEKVDFDQTFELAEKYVQELEKNYAKTVAQTDNEQRYKIARELGEQYFEVAKLAIKEVQPTYKISAYFVQAIKFGSTKAMYELFNDKNPLKFTFLFNIFVLALAEIPSYLQQEVHLNSFIALTRIENFWNTKNWSQRNMTFACAASMLKDYLSKFYTYEVDDFKRRKIMTDFLIPKLEKFSPWETKLLAYLSDFSFDSFRPASDELFELINFCKERSYISQTSLWAYADYFGALAESYPDEYKKLVFAKEINQLISDTYFLDNKILKDIEFIKWVNANWTQEVGFSAWAGHNQDEIFYIRTMQCCQENEIYLGEVLQYLKAISKEFIFVPNEELLELMRNIIDMGQYEYIKFVLTVTERVLKGMTKSSSEEKWNEIKSINRRWLDFYNFYSQPGVQLEIILNFSMGQIRTELEGLAQEKSKPTGLSGLLELSAIFSSNNNVKVFSELPKIVSSLKRLEGMSTAFRFKLKSELKQQKKQTEDVIEGAQYFLEELVEFRKSIPVAPPTTIKLFKVIDDFATDIKIIIKNSEKDLADVDSLILLKEEILLKERALQNPSKNAGEDEGEEELEAGSPGLD